MRTRHREGGSKGKNDTVSFEIHGDSVGFEKICTLNGLRNIGLMKFVLKRMIVERKIFETELPRGNNTTICIYNCWACI